MKSLTTPPRLLSYLIYGIILTSVLLYIRFPSDKFKIFVENRAEQIISDTECSINKIRYNFPLSLVFEKTKLVKRAEGQQTVVTIDNLKIRPGVQFWQTFILHGELYAGTINATLDINKQESSYTFTNIVLKDLNLDKIIEDQGITNRKVSGSLSGAGNYTKYWREPTTSLGKMQITATSGNLQLLQPVLSLSSVDYEQISFDLSIGEESKIEEGKLKGKDILADFEGTVTMLNSMYNSRLQVSGSLELRREFLQTHPVEANMVKQYVKRYKNSELPFTMGGTLSTPTFRLSR